MSTLSNTSGQSNLSGISQPPDPQEQKAPALKEEMTQKQVRISVEEDEKETDNSMEIYEPSYSWLCCTAYKDRSKFQNLLQNIDLSPVQKQIIKTRYLNILENFQKRSRNYGIIFYIGHVVITVGSLFVPALLSIQNSDKSYVYENNSFTIHVYWATFILSLLVTIFNGILTLFKIDKKYYFLNTTLERLRTEGWQYFSLTGRYSGQLLKKEKLSQKPTYRNQFIYFTHYIEKIKMKQVEEEYYKTDERAAQTPNQTTIQPSTQYNGIRPKPEMFSPSPDMALDVMSSAVPEPVFHTVNGMVKSHTITQPSTKSNVSSTSTISSARQKNKVSSLPLSGPPSPVSDSPLMMRANNIQPSHRSRASTPKQINMDSDNDSHTNYPSQSVTPSESHITSYSNSNQGTPINDSASLPPRNTIMVPSLHLNPLHHVHLEDRLHELEHNTNQSL